MPIKVEFSEFLHNSNQKNQPHTIRTKNLYPGLKNLLGTKIKFTYIFAKICQNNDGEAHFLHIKSYSINCRCESTLENSPKLSFKLSQLGFNYIF